MCLDIRNGEILCNENLPNGSTTVVAVADPERKKLEIRCNSMTAILAFSDTKPEEKPAKGGEPVEKSEANQKREEPPVNPDRQSRPRPAPDPFGDPFDR
jgi:hypothetical protein